MDDARKNKEGYLDPTAYEAIRNIERGDERFKKLLHTIFYICDLAGFQIEGRIIFVDKKTGQIWK